MIAGGYLFELEGDALESATAGDDWQTLYNGGGSAIAVVSPMPISDKGMSSGTALLDSIFKSSSDVNDIGTWDWVVADANKPGALPAKDNTTNAYAAAYLDDSGDMVLFFGQDRFAANGTSDIGFWFLQNEVQVVPDDPDCPATTIGCTGSFSGSHQVGDVLVLSAFTNGGTVDTIEIYEWVGTGGEAGGGVLHLLHRGTQADCATIPAGEPACAIINHVNATSPWTYLAKENGSVAQVFPPNHFFEGGVNLTDLGIRHCFSTFLSETRSSSSLTAQLKDFALGEFGVCEMAVDKTGPAKSKIGDEVTYTFTITNAGAMSMQLKSVVDDRIGDLAAYLPEACELLAPSASCAFNVPWTIPSDAADPYVNTVTVKYIEEGGDVATAVEFSASDDHSIDLFQPAISLHKTADALSKVGDTVHYSVTLDNDSSSDTPDLECTLTDPLAGFTEELTLAAGASATRELSYVVQQGDADPLVNSAHAECSPTGFPNVLTADASASTNLFQPAIDLSKTGDAQSKVGDPVGYTLTVRNDSSSDTPTMHCRLTDPMLGIDQELTLASGAEVTVDGSYTVKPGDPDPLVNLASVSCSPEGFDNVLSDTATHSVDLFQPSISLSKAGDALSKVGDVVHYSLTLENTSSSDSPVLDCSVSDPLVGFTKEVSLSPGTSDVSELSYTVQSGDPDPLINTASASCTPRGYPNVLTAEASHLVNLFQPAMHLTASGDALSKVGDAVSYSAEVHNDSSEDSPRLTCTVVDTLTGLDLTFDVGPGGTVSLADLSYTVQPDDPDPLIEVFSVQCSPVGFPNVLTDSKSVSTNLFQPAIALEKTGDVLSKVGDDVHYALTVSNLSSIDTPTMSCLLSDPMLGLSEPVVLVSGASQQVDATYTVKEGDPDPLPNLASVSCSPSGFPNVLTATDGHSVNLFQPSLSFSKSGPAFSKPGDTAAYELTLTNTSSGDAPALHCTITDTMLAIAQEAVLASGEVLTLQGSYVVQPGDPDPLVNTAVAECSPEGFPNVLRYSATAVVDLVHPAFTVVKTCLVDPVPVGAPASFRVTLSNSGDADLVFELSDPSMPSINGTYAVAAGQSATLDGTVTYAMGATSVSNTVSAHVTLAATYQLDNAYDASSSATCQIPPSFEGCTPGGWKNVNGRMQLWDQPTDPLAIVVGFYTGTSFNGYLGLTPSQSGFSNSLTMAGAINLGGGGNQKLARHGVAALLNAGSGLNYMYPAGTSDLATLKTAIRNAFINGTYEPLATQLANANSQICPVSF